MFVIAPVDLDTAHNHNHNHSGRAGYRAVARATSVWRARTAMTARG